jgi:hypothetical protein
VARRKPPEPRRGVYNWLDEANFADLPAPKIIEMECQTAPTERKQRRSVLSRLENKALDDEAIRKGDVELPDFDDRTWEGFFQRPFCKQGKVSRCEIDPRSKNNCQSKENAWQDAQPAAPTAGGKPIA